MYSFLHIYLVICVILQKSLKHLGMGASDNEIFYLETFLFIVWLKLQISI